MSCIGLAFLASAAPVAPGAGEILKTVPSPIPPPPAPATTNPVPSPPGAERPPFRGDLQQRIAVKRIVITGNTVFPESELLALVRDAPGQTLTLEALNGLAARITDYYRKRGYLLARAYIPAQDVTEGTLEIAVLEGRYGKIRLDNQSRISDSALERLLQPLKIGQPVEAGLLEQQLLLLSDLPGAAISSTLQPGVGTGTSDLAVTAAQTPAVSGSAGIDNWGNRYTGSWRTSANVDWASPLGQGDRLDLYGMGSEFGGTQFGRLAYDLPVGSSGTRLGAAYADLKYALGLDFAPLRAHGSAEITSLYASQPLTRSRLDNSTLTFDVDRRILRDFIDSTSGSDAKVENVANLGLNGSLKSVQGATTFWNASVTSGRLTLDPVSAVVDQAAYHTAGTYFKANGSGSQLWPLEGRWAFYGALSGQLASTNLDMSEKFSMGGPTGVRAYPVGEAMSDDAWLGTLEMRYALDEFIELSGFADGGTARINHTPIAADAVNQRSLSGLGLGAAWKNRRNLSVLTYFAWRTGDAPTSAPERRPTVWAQLTQGF